MEKSIGKNYIYTLFYQVLAMVLPVITTPYLSRVLGAESIGIYSYTLSIATYFILFGSLGVAKYGLREIAYFQDDIKERSKVFFEILIIRFITLGLALISFYFIFCNNNEYQLYYKILILEILASSIDISWFFQGIEEFKKTVIRNSIIKLISVILIFILIKSPEDLVKYFIIYVISNFLGNITLWFYIPKYVTTCKTNKLNLIRHLKPTFEMFIPQIAIQIYTVLDKTMIGVIVSDKSEVGYYEQAQKIIKLLMTIATSFATVMSPRMANTFAKKDFEKMKKYMYQSFSFILLIAIPLMFGIVSISKHFVPIFFGNGYEKVTILINVISPIILAISLANVTGTQYLIQTNQQKKYTLSVICGALVNFTFNLLFIRLWSSIGASITTVIAEFVVTGIQFYLIRNEISFKEVVFTTYKYFVASIIMFLISCLIGIIINNDIISIIVQVTSSTIIYILLLILFKDKFFKSIYNYFLEKIKIKKLKGKIDE